MVGVESWASTFSQDEIDSIIGHIQNNESIKFFIQSTEGELFIEIEEGKIKNTDIVFLEGVSLFGNDFQVTRATDSGKWLLSYQGQSLGIIDSITNNIRIECKLP